MEYSVCNQQQVFTTEGNSTLELPNRVTLQFSLPGDSDCYMYTIRASDGTNTVVVEGRMNQSGKHDIHYRWHVHNHTVIMLLFLYR